MKKLLLIIPVLLISMYVNAQEFVLTSNGFMDSANLEKDYVVVPFDGKKQQEIFDLALAAINKVGTIRINGLNKVEYSQISVNGILPHVSHRGALGKRWYFDMNFNITIEVKDNKLKINAPQIIEIKQEAALGDVYIFISSKEKKGSLTDIALFYKNGKNNPNHNQHRLNIEAATNNLIASIINLMTENKSDDW